MVARKLINFKLFAVSLLLLIAGLILLGSGTVDGFKSLTLAPILLSLVYVVGFPLSVLLQKK